MTKEQRFLILSITERMVEYYMKDYKMSMLDAFKAIYQSPKYSILADPETGLYIQSPKYVYTFFNS